MIGGNPHKTLLVGLSFYFSFDTLYPIKVVKFRLLEHTLAVDFSEDILGGVVLDGS